MKEYDFIIKANMTADVYIEAESEAEALKLANEMEYFPKNAVVESITVFGKNFNV